MSMEEQKKRRTRRKFTDEFKARAVRLVLKEGQTAAQVARDLDLIESVLHSWVRQAKIDRGMGPAGAPSVITQKRPYKIGSKPAI